MNVYDFQIYSLVCALALFFCLFCIQLGQSALEKSLRSYHKELKQIETNVVQNTGIVVKHPETELLVEYAKDLCNSMTEGKMTGDVRQKLVEEHMKKVRSQCRRMERRERSPARVKGHRKEH